MFRRRKGATIRFTLNTNSKLYTDDDLSIATKREIHVLPPPNDDGTPRAEIILTNASIVDTWKLSATLTPTQSNIAGDWYAAAYAEWNNGGIVKISKTVAFRADPKYTP